MLADELTRHFDVTAQAADAAVLPVDHAEAHRLFDASTGARQSIEGLRDSIRRECFGNPDRLGLCSECGKVVDPPRAGHDPGGCLSIIAEPVVAIVRTPKRLCLRARYHWRQRGSAR